MGPATHCLETLTFLRSGDKRVIGTNVRLGKDLPADGLPKFEDWIIRTLDGREVVQQGSLSPPLGPESCTSGARSK